MILQTRIGIAGSDKDSFEILDKNICEKEGIAGGYQDELDTGCDYKAFKIRIRKSRIDGKERWRSNDTKEMFARMAYDI
mgnify:CR=1 FL=1